ncbi:TioE family transcriptional regulator, partial [Streptomyces mirabilis]|uniref:TioE family transcriptional regulator n=1 Tax=Streptomyces mirabilis TaxID=68239 RepID=UPI003652AD17
VPPPPPRAHSPRAPSPPPRLGALTLGGGPRRACRTPPPRGPNESHAQLLDDRRTLQAVERALRGLEPTVASEPNAVSGPAGRFIGPLAGELGIRPATLRKWERAGLVRPRRDPRTGYRVYDEADMRDARLAHQLRRGGYLLEQIAPLIAQVRAAGGPEPLEAALRDWHGRLSVRGRAMLAGAAELEAYLRERG